MRDAAAPVDNTGYKALVCVFLAGGNDYANTLIPFESSNQHTNLYAPYRTGNLSIDWKEVYNENISLGTVLSTIPHGANWIYALNPNLKNVANYFNSGKAAILLNVGVVNMPYNGENLALVKPARLYSHIDQTALWQTMDVEGARSTGWGGNMVSTIASGGTFNAISINNGSVFLNGSQATPYNLRENNFVTCDLTTAGSATYYDKNIADALNGIGGIWKTPGNHHFEKIFNATVTTAIENAQTLSKANTEVPTEVSSSFSSIETSADAQMFTVAKLIAARDTINAPNRQVFLVTMPGFDLHSDMRGHGSLLGQLDTALGKFLNAMEALSLDKQVTTFTMSEFGRTLTTNGDGTDHGWGNHHFILGGAVKGNAFYGKAPPVDIADQSWHDGQGRLIPTTPMEQYAATLGKWFGVPDSDLVSIFRNRNNFNNNPLGFL